MTTLPLRLPVTPQVKGDQSQAFPVKEPGNMFIPSTMLPQPVDQAEDSFGLPGRLPALDIELQTFSGLQAGSKLSAFGL
jgi:hypothetical protein